MNVAHVLKIEQYETWCDVCDWSLTFSPGDPDAGSMLAARKNAIRALREHEATHRETCDAHDTFTAEHEPDRSAERVKLT